MRPFIFQTLGRHPYGKREHGPETSENQLQNEVFGLISSNFQHYLKKRNKCDVKYCSALLL